MKCKWNRTGLYQMEVRHYLTKKDLKSYSHFWKRAKGEPSNNRSISFISMVLKALEHNLQESIIENMEVNRAVRCSTIDQTEQAADCGKANLCLNKAGLPWSIQKNTVVKKIAKADNKVISKSVRHVKELARREESVTKNGKVRNLLTNPRNSCEICWELSTWKQWENTVLRPVEYSCKAASQISIRTRHRGSRRATGGCPPRQHEKKAKRTHLAQWNASCKEIQLQNAVERWKKFKHAAVKGQMGLTCQETSVMGDR